VTRSVKTRQILKKKEKKVTGIRVVSRPRATICSAALRKIAIRWRVLAVSVLALPSTRRKNSRKCRAVPLPVKMAKRKFDYVLYILL